MTSVAEAADGPLFAARVDPPRPFSVPDRRTGGAAPRRHESDVQFRFTSLSALEGPVGFLGPIWETAGRTGLHLAAACA